MRAPPIEFFQRQRDKLDAIVYITVDNRPTGQHGDRVIALHVLPHPNGFIEAANVGRVPGIVGQLHHIAVISVAKHTKRIIADVRQTDGIPRQKRMPLRHNEGQSIFKQWSKAEFSRSSLSARILPRQSHTPGQ